MFYWNGVETRASSWRGFKKLQYSTWPVYQEEFLRSWERKRKKKGRLLKAERKAAERFLKRVEKEGDGFAAARVYIEKIDEHVGFGLFARKKIRKGTIIGMYSGRAIPAKKDNPSRYLFFFSKMKDWDIDAKTTRNYTAFMNHASARGAACNIKSIEFYCEQPKILFIAMRDIQKGSQLCYDYGDDYWDPLEKTDDFKRVSQKKRFQKDGRTQRR